MKHHAVAAFISISAIIASGCGGPPLPSQETPLLSEVALETPFDFATTAPVVVFVATPPGALRGRFAQVTISKPDGARLVRSAVADGRPLTLELALARTDTFLRVRLTNQDVDFEREVAIVDGRAVLEL